MAKKRRLATIFTYLTLELGAMLGVPIRLDQIEEMTRLLNQAQMAQVVSVQREDGGEIRQGRSRFKREQGSERSLCERLKPPKQTESGGRLCVPIAPAAQLLRATV